MTKVVSLLPRQHFEMYEIEKPQQWELIFQYEHGTEDIIKSCKGADFLLVPAGYPYITAGILDNIPSISMVQVFGTGFDKVDIQAAASANIPVANTPGVNSGTVAEFTVGMIIALQRRIVHCDREIKEGRHSEIKQRIIREGQKEISGTKVGLIGLGAIGRRVAFIASMLGAIVSYYDPLPLSVEDERELSARFSSFEEILVKNEVISLHLPLTEHTKNLIGARELSLMKKDTLLINTSRGAVVDQHALADALENGNIAGAAIDTLYPEPPLPDHPLLNLSRAASEKLLLTPHIAGVTKRAFAEMLKEAILNIEKVTRGGLPKYIVNGIIKPRRTAK